MKVFYSSLSQEECIRRIKEKSRCDFFGIDSLTVFLTLFDFDKHFLFRVEGNQFTLQKVYVRNINRPIFDGKFIKESKGTRIEGEFYTHWSALVFDYIWFTGAVITGGFTIFLTLKHLVIKGVRTPETYIGIIAPILLLFFGIGITKAMRDQAKRWKYETIDFIEKTLEVK